MGVLGAAEHHCRQTCHGRGHNKNVPWGNIPIVLLLGDDYQLPSVSVGKKGFGATRILISMETEERKLQISLLLTELHNFSNLSKK